MIPFVTPLFGTAPPAARAMVLSGPDKALSTYGVSPGDLLVLVRINSVNAPPSSGSGQAWTKMVETTGPTMSAFAKFAAPADVAAAIDAKAPASSGGRPSFQIAVYRNVASYAVRRSGKTATGSAPQTVAGFDKAARHAGLLAILGASDGDSLSLTSPADFKTAASVTGSGAMTLLDRLYPTAAYVDGTAFSLSHIDDCPYAILELLS